MPSTVVKVPEVVSVFSDKAGNAVVEFAVGGRRHSYLVKQHMIGELIQALEQAATKGFLSKTVEETIQ